MEMPDIKEYLQRIRGYCDKDQIIIVPNTTAYQIVLMELKDPNIILKEPNMDLSKLGRKIIK